MAAMGGIKHNLQPREENSWPVSETELDNLASFGFVSSLLAAIATAFASNAVMLAFQAVIPWTSQIWSGIALCTGVSVSLYVWSYREIRRGKRLLQRIKRSPKPRVRANGNGETAAYSYRRPGSSRYS